MRICVTGKAGSGKTTVARMLKSRIGNSVIIDADKIGNALLSDRKIKGRLAKAFGQRIISDNRIDRKVLADMAFSSKKKLRLLNSMVHPPLIRQIKRSAQMNKTSIIDAALYHELHLDKISDCTILVRISNASARRRLGRNIFGRRKYQQEPKKADFIINNNISILDLRRQVGKIANQL